MQHILILSASVGAGHMRAAQAVELAARELYPEAYVQNMVIAFGLALLLLSFTTWVASPEDGPVVEEIKRFLRQGK